MNLGPQAINRRTFILSGAAAVGTAGAAALLWPANSQGVATAAAGGTEGVVRLSAGTGVRHSFGPGRTEPGAWAYNGQVPGPGIRARAGDLLRVVVDNELEEGTTVHWHGVRVPNAMDGVPELTQKSILPGERLVYEFPLHDAGTFWYHPHQRSFEQVGRGLYGPLIVEETNPIKVDREITWMLDDWRLDGQGQISGGFGSRHDATMSGRIGNTVTINGRLPQPLSVRKGERIRLRLINAANARIFGLNFEGHDPRIIAMDGQPVTPHRPDGPILLGPAMRIDLVLDMMSEPGTRSRIRDGFYDGLEFDLTQIHYSGSPLRDQPLTTPIVLPPNPLQEPTLNNAQRHEVVFGGGMMGMMAGGAMSADDGGGGMMNGSNMGGGMMGGSSNMMGWTVNGVSASGHVHDPILTIPKGQSVILTLKNKTAWWHPIHVHGHSFRVLSRNGKPTAHKEWQDTVLMSPQETAEIAFVADNPGDWMLHCHILEHQAAGMMASFRVT